jgi:hypothetical protein
MRKQHQRLIPDELLQAIDVHARAIIAGDSPTAERFVEERANEAHRAALARINSGARPSAFEVIARARLGGHYIVKIRFLRDQKSVAAIQNRWRCEDGRWGIAEVEDLGLHSPWKKPDKPAEVNANA